MSILFCLASLLVASLGGMIIGIDPSDTRVVEYQSQFWTIIGIGFVPAVIELVFDEYRVSISRWLKLFRLFGAKSLLRAEEPH